MKHRNDRGEKRIYTHSFSKYFTLRIPSGELPDQYIEKTLISWKESAHPVSDIQETFDTMQKAGKLLELLSKLTQVYFYEILDLAPDIIRAIYKNIAGFSRDDLGFFESSEYSRGEHLLLVLADQLPSDQIHPLLQETIESTDDIVCATYIVLACKKGGQLNNIHQTVQLDALVKILEKRYSEYFIDTHRDIFEILPDDFRVILDSWGSGFGTSSGQAKNTVNNYIRTLMVKLPSHISILLDGLSSVDHNNVTYFKLDELGEIYELEMLDGFARQALKNEERSDDKRELLNQYVEAYEAFAQVQGG